jgi:presenilin-like A22 family membrane protease
MPPESWLLIAILGVIVAHGLGCAYRLAWTMLSDVILLIVLTGAAMGASYLFG